MTAADVFVQGACGMALMVLVSVAYAVPAPATGAAAVAVVAPGCSRSDDAAVYPVIARVRREHLYASWTTPDCLIYVVDSWTVKAVDVSIHEKHDTHCGGDPLTSPRADSFRVYRRGGRIDWYDVVNDRYRPFEKIHSEGHR